jgi:hypothetical protein
VPRLCEFYPGICLTTAEKARKNLSQGKKNLSQVKKDLSQSIWYILPKPSQTHTLQNPHIHTHYKPPSHTRTHTRTHTHARTHARARAHARTHTLQNNIKPPQYKLIGISVHPNTMVKFQSVISPLSLENLLKSHSRSA